MTTTLKNFIQHTDQNDESVSELSNELSEILKFCGNPCMMELESTLRYSVYRRMFDFAKVFIDSGIDINSINDRGMALLHEMVKRSDLEAVQFLIKEGADVDVLSSYDETPLFYIIESKTYNEQCFQFLLDSGANINHQNTEGSTALMEACLADNTEVVNFLLNNMADVYIKNNSGDDLAFIAQSVSSDMIVSMIKRRILSMGSEKEQVINDSLTL